MDVETLIILIIGLMLLLGLLALIFVVFRYRAAKAENVTKVEILTMMEMLEIVRDNNSGVAELKKVVSNTIENFLDISDEEYENYDQLMVSLCSHRMVNKDLVLELDRALSKNNPAFKDKLQATLKKALNKRG